MVWKTPSFNDSMVRSSFGGANQSSMESWWLNHFEALAILPRGGVSACSAM